MPLNPNPEQRGAASASTQASGPNSPMDHQGDPLDHNNPLGNADESTTQDSTRDDNKKDNKGPSDGKGGVQPRSRSWLSFLLLSPFLLLRALFNVTLGRFFNRGSNEEVDPSNSNPLRPKAGSVPPSQVNPVNNPTDPNNPVNNPTYPNNKPVQDPASNPSGQLPTVTPKPSADPKPQDPLPSAQNNPDLNLPPQEGNDDDQVGEPVPEETQEEKDPLDESSDEKEDKEDPMGPGEDGSATGTKADLNVPSSSDPSLVRTMMAESTAKFNNVVTGAVSNIRGLFGPKGNFLKSAKSFERKTSGRLTTVPLGNVLDKGKDVQEESEVDSSASTSNNGDSSEQ